MAHRHLPLRSFVFCGLLLLAACPPADPDAELNQPPTAPTIQLSPPEPKTGDTVIVEILELASDPDGDPLSLHYVWTQDGVPRADLAGDTLAPALTEKGERWRVEVLADNGRARSEAAVAEIVIVDTPPTVTVSLTPIGPRTGDVVTGNVVGADADGEAVTYGWSWTVDGLGTDLTDGLAPPGTASRGQWLELAVVPTAAGVTGVAATASVLIGDSAPVATRVHLSPESPGVADLLLATAEGDDADGDAVAWTWTWFVSDLVVIGAVGPQLSGAFVRGDLVSVTAVPDDGELLGEPLSSAEIVVGNSPPTATGAAIDPPELFAATTANCMPSGFSDVDGDPEGWTYQWFREGLPIAAGPSFQDFVRGDSVYCEATPWDSWASGTAVQSPVVVVGNSPPTLTLATVDPAVLTETGVATCLAAGWSDADGDAEGWTVRWWVDALLVATGPTLDGADWARGDTVRCELTPNDGFSPGPAVLSAGVVVINSPPTAPGVLLGPAQASPGVDPLFCGVMTPSTDPDGDAVGLWVGWTLDGQPWPDPSDPPGGPEPATTTILGDTIPVEATLEGQVWTCEVLPHDGFDPGPPGTSTLALGPAAPIPSPDWTLIDLNPNSLTWQAPVSPRDHLEVVSGWYFIHST